MSSYSLLISSCLYNLIDISVQTVNVIIQKENIKISSDLKFLKFVFKYKIFLINTHLVVFTLCKLLELKKGININTFLSAHIDF